MKLAQKTIKETGHKVTISLSFCAEFDSESYGKTQSEKVKFSKEQTWEWGLRM